MVGRDRRDPHRRLGLSIPRGPDNRSLAQLIGLGDSPFARIGLQTALGLLCLVTLPFVVHGCAWISAAFSRLLLTGVAEMRNTIGVLTSRRRPLSSPRRQRYAGWSAIFTTARSSGWCGWRWT